MVPPKKKKGKPRKRAVKKQKRRTNRPNPYRASRRQDWDSAESKKFRRAVKVRDRYECQLCGAKKRLQVHHILTYKDFPQYRTDPNNGICLCDKCHKMVNRVEYLYVKTFTEIVARNNKRMNGGEK